MIRLFSHDDGGERPVCICDQCGEQITDYRQALYTWKTLVERKPQTEDDHTYNLMEPGTIYTLHRVCSKPFEKRNSIDGKGRFLAWMDMLDLPVFLAMSMGMDQATFDERIQMRQLANAEGNEAV